MEQNTNQYASHVSTAVTCVECRTPACDCPTIEESARIDEDMQAVLDAGTLCSRRQIQQETTCRVT